MENFLKEDGGLKKVARKRVGIAGMKAPARQHTELFDASGENKIGEVTSGTFSPTLKKVRTSTKKRGTKHQRCKGERDESSLFTPCFMAKRRS